MVQRAKFDGRGNVADIILEPRRWCHEKPMAPRGGISCHSTSHSGALT
jgi:hypothetical protein